MWYYALAVARHCGFCRPRTPDKPDASQPNNPPETPKPPPSSPVIEPIATQPNEPYPDLPTLNPSLVRDESDTTYTV